MQSAQTGNDVRTERLIEWLRDAHAMEAQAETMLNKQASRIEHYPELKARIEQHITETQNQAKLIEGCLQRYDKRSEEHTSELQSLMRISYAVFCLHNTLSKQMKEQVRYIKLK